ncbi:MAG: hypothetical protein AB1631_04150 [Acidobacteriota bacterium]
MPTDQLPVRPKIRFIFRGFLITRIRDGAAGAEIGALAISQCHQPKITIIEITPEGAENPVDHAFDLDSDFSLSVENVAQSGIQVFQADTEPFNRLDDENDPRDFRWVIDLEELLRKPLQVDETKLGPIVTMDNGLFYTFGRSPGEVKIKRPGARLRRFGRYGLDIGANIYFDQPDSRAVFKNGDEEILSVDATQGSRFEIVFDCNCHTDTQESDFPLVYEVVGAGLTEEEKVDFEGDPIRTGGSANPEVYCAGGNVPGGG